MTFAVGLICRDYVIGNQSTWGEREETVQKIISKKRKHLCSWLVCNALWFGLFCVFNSVDVALHRILSWRVLLLLGNVRKLTGMALKTTGTLDGQTWPDDQIFGSGFHTLFLQPSEVVKLLSQFPVLWNSVHGLPQCLWFGVYWEMTQRETSWKWKGKKNKLLEI